MDPNLTRDANSAMLEQSIPGMAHFAGSGPKGKVCGVCEYWQPEPGKLYKVCHKYHEFMNTWSHRSIPFHTMACKYFVAAKRNAKK